MALPSPTPKPTARPTHLWVEFRRDGRVVGGAVRNHLFGEEIRDIDIATTCLPEQTLERAQAAGLRTVPTGIEHGTVLVVADHHGFEVTTLREDVETDGRRARVSFGRSWEHDARRRDFTVNALYCEADGTIVDFVGALPDVVSRTIRFIGDADDRIGKVLEHMTGHDEIERSVGVGQTTDIAAA